MDGKKKFGARRRKPQAEVGQMRPAEDVLDLDELVSIVCKYFCRGKTPRDIQGLFEEIYKVEITREAIYKYIRIAGKEKRLQFDAPREDELSETIRTKYGLQQVEVVHTGVMDDVADKAATMIVDLLKEFWRKRSKEEVHLGFFGGESTRRVAQRLSARLAGRTIGLPKKLVFHALVAGFDVDRPMTDPGGYFTYFMSQAIQLETEFVGLHAPAVVPLDRLKEVEGWPGIAEARNRVHEVDVVISSAAQFSDEHSMLKRLYAKTAPDIVERLHAARCVGDYFWSPISHDGPIDNNEFRYRSMTLFDFASLPTFLQRGGQVLLTLGPCGACIPPAPKSEILRAILNSQVGPLLTHLVVDSRTARGAFQAPSSPFVVI